MNYFTKDKVLSKLEGYSRMRADLHIKVLVNGSPFRYGELMMSYRPLFAAETSSDHPHAILPFFSGGNISGDLASAPGYPNQDYTAVASDASTHMARSQRMNIRIQPHINSGGEMILPFIYYRDALDITNLTTDIDKFRQRLRELGTITLEQLVMLKSTSTANATGVSITVFAWAENMQLWGPTGINVQGKDEFEEVLEPSGQASAVAEAAGKLAAIPVIRPYALATQFLAGSSAAALKYFGWSNPPVLTAVPGRLPKASFLNPGPCSSFPDDVLALDPKNELTVDPRTVGDLAKDPLILSDFCSRSAIVDILPWNISYANDVLLGEFPVQPAYWRGEWRNRATGKFDSIRMTMTPATYIAQMFEYWRGTAVFNFKVVCSQFHRGRLIASWDPAACAPSLASKSGAVISHVIDLATATEMTIKIPYMSHLGMLKTRHEAYLADTQAKAEARCWSDSSSTFGWSTKEMFESANGVLQLRVLNFLQCGDDTADIKIIVSVHFEDMVMMCPTIDSVSPAAKTTVPSAFSRISLSDFADQTVSVQGDQISIMEMNVQGLEAPGTSEDIQTISGGSGVEEYSKLYGGEYVPSLRTLLHRTYPYRVKSTISGGTGNDVIMASLNIPRFPVPNHTRVNGFNDAVPTSATTMNTNMLLTNPISLLTACFAGYRGSLVWKAYCMSGAQSLTLTRAYPNIETLALAWAGMTSSDARQFDTVALASLNANNGMSWTTRDLAGTVAAVMPQYNNFRMMPGNPITHYLKPKDELLYWFENDGVQVVAHKAEGPSFGMASKTTIATSVAAGTDYNVFAFINVPDIYLSGGIST